MPNSKMVDQIEIVSKKKCNLKPYPANHKQVKT